MRLLLSYFITLLFIAAAIWYFTTTEVDFAVLLKIPFHFIIAILFSNAAFIYLSGRRFEILMRVYDVSLKTSEWLGLTVITRFGSLFLPASGGAVFRALYLKQVHGMNLTEFAGSAGGILIYNLISNLVLLIPSVVVLLAFNPNAGLSKVLVWMLLFAIMSTMAVALSIKYTNNIKNQHVKTIMGGARKIWGKRSLARALLLNQFFVRAVSAVLIWLAFSAIGIHVNIWESLVISILIALTVLISLTPGNIGFTESVMATFGTLTGSYGISEGLLAALYLRIIDVTIVLIFGLVFSRILALKAVSKKTD